MSISFSPHIPSYDGGITAAAIYNAGPMLADDSINPTAEDCPMRLVTETTEAEYKAYIEKLKSAGFSIVFENSTPAAECAQLLKPETSASGKGTLLYVYHTKNAKETRIIEDKASVPASDFSYAADADGHSTEIYQYALYYDKRNDHSPTTTNCGMLYIIKLSDNSLFVIDGGHMLQCSAEAVSGLREFLHKITGTAENGTIHVSAWYFTHAHDDHMAACVRLLRTYPAEIDIQRVMFNFPSYITRPQGYSEDIFVLKSTLREMYPGVKCLKLHTGQKFTLANAEFEVMYTHEDAVNAENSAIFPFRDFNCTSPIIKMTTDSGTVMWLGDTNTETEALVKQTVPKEMWKSDVVQIAHHCFNYLSTLYVWIDADYAMLPNSCYAGHTVENEPKLMEVVAQLASPENLWYEDKTTGFRFENGKYCVIYEAPRIGGEHDGTDLYGNNPNKSV